MTTTTSAAGSNELLPFRDALRWNLNRQLIAVALALTTASSLASGVQQATTGSSNVTPPPPTASTTMTTTTATATATNRLPELHEREFVSPQAHIQMDCQRDKTVIRVNFTRPFNGILGAGNPGATKCKLLGAGERFYELRVNHNATEECGAQWDPATSSIANTLFIRFHQSLETGADIVKNVLCRLTVGDLIVGRRPASAMKRQQNSKIIRAIRS